MAEIYDPAFPTLDDEDDDHCHLKEKQNLKMTEDNVSCNGCQNSEMDDNSHVESYETENKYVEVKNVGIKEEVYSSIIEVTHENIVMCTNPEHVIVTLDSQDNKSVLEAPSLDSKTAYENDEPVQENCLCLDDENQKDAKLASFQCVIPQDLAEGDTVIAFVSQDVEHVPSELVDTTEQSNSVNISHDNISINSHYTENCNSTISVSSHFIASSPIDTQEDVAVIDVPTTVDECVLPESSDVTDVIEECIPGLQPVDTMGENFTVIDSEVSFKNIPYENVQLFENCTNETLTNEENSHIDELDKPESKVMQHEKVYEEETPGIQRHQQLKQFECEVQEKKLDVSNTLQSEELVSRLQEHEKSEIIGSIESEELVFEVKDIEEIQTDLKPVIVCNVQEPETCNLQPELASDIQKTESSIHLPEMIYETDSSRDLHPELVCDIPETESSRHLQTEVICDVQETENNRYLHAELVCDIQDSKCSRYLQLELAFQETEINKHLKSKLECNVQETEISRDQPSELKYNIREKEISKHLQPELLCGVQETITRHQQAEELICGELQEEIKTESDEHQHLDGIQEENGHKSNSDETSAGRRRSSRIRSIAEKREKEKEGKETKDKTKTDRDTCDKDTKNGEREHSRKDKSDAENEVHSERKSSKYDKQKYDKSDRYKSRDSRSRTEYDKDTSQKSRYESSRSDRHESSRSDNRRESSRYDRKSDSKGSYRYRSRSEKDFNRRDSKPGRSKRSDNSRDKSRQSEDRTESKPRRRRSTSVSEKHSLDTGEEVAKVNKIVTFEEKPEIVQEIEPVVTESLTLEETTECQEEKHEKQEHKLEEKREAEDHSILKPEKVKSRWRRSSELEHGELSGSSTTVTPEPVERKSPEVPRLKETLCSISEEQPLPPEFTEKISEEKEKLTEEKEKLKPPYYDELEENVYRFERTRLVASAAYADTRRRSKSKKEVRRMLCDCTLTKEERERGIPGCEEDCLNRLLMIECGSRCATGDACSNKRFQKKHYVKAEPFKTEKKGWGLKVLEEISSGRFVMEYVGEVLNPQEFKQRVKQYAREKYSHYYFMALKSDEIIDATNKGNLSRFINHSCNPNCETQKWTVNGELRIGFFAKRSLKAGEELTFDYQFQRYGKEAQKCFCESEKCRGYIGEDKQISLKSYSTSKSTSNKRRKTTEEKKREVLEDLALEEEIEKLSANGGLRNREQTLMLARLMVRAEDIHTRQRLLDIIQKTNEQACLRLFLDYHGLSLMWSWMVDVVDSQLKAKILQVLSALPIPNKTMLLDSKVMNVVQRWSLQLCDHKGDIEKENEMVETEQSSEPPSGATTPRGGDENHEPPLKKIKMSDTSDSEPDIGTYLRLRESDVILSQSTNLVVNNSSNNNSTQNETVQESGDVSVKTEVIASSLSPDPSKSATEPSKITETVPRSDEESRDTMDEDEERKSGAELTNLASKLLESWSGLKEVFRIPRLEQQKRREDEREADRRDQERGHSRHQENDNYERSNSRERDSFKDKEHMDRDYSPVKDRKNRDKGRDRDRGRDYDSYQERRSSLDSPEWRDERRYSKSQKKNLHNEPEEPQARPRKALLPTPPRLSKEERRQLFAMEVQQRDQEEALRRQQEEKTNVEEYTSKNTFNYNTYPQYYDPNAYNANTYDPNAYNDPSYTANSYNPNQTYMPSECQIPMTASPMPSTASPQTIALPNDGSSSMPPPIRTALLPTPTFVEPVAPQMSMAVPPPHYPDPSAPMMYPPPNMLFQPPPTQLPFLGAPPPTLTQPPPIMSQPPPTVQMPPSAPLSGMNHLLPPGPIQTGVPGITPVTAAMPPPVAAPIPTPAPAAVPPSVPAAAQVPTATPVQTSAIAPIPSGASIPPAGPIISNQTPLPAAPVTPSYLPSQTQFVNPQSQPVYYVQPSNTTAVVTLPEQVTIQQTVPVMTLSSTIIEETPVSPPPKPKPTKLPPNWKTAKDSEDNIYYYHAITRQTQWDPPTWDQIEDDMDLGTPTFDEPKQSKKKSTTTAAADTSSEVAKKIKELFRTKMSSFIVQCLNPYRKPDCTLGRITSTEDFKHLARKLTHFVMAKELKHCKNVEDLECNDNVKHKAKDFIQKYMAKYGSLYRKDKTTSPKDD